MKRKHEDKRRATVELRYAEDAETGRFLDEVVAILPDSIHIEMMDRGYYWMAVYPKDRPSGSRTVLHFTSDTPIRLRAEEE